ncbi:Druantia anti-phage system protein DruA [Micromonospora sp. NPDC049048]|uniref:Druantia anti-phage system protein DruA n=1 Tax=Micromonospora sp. NPDC049048 TaxID=3364263 RepID=UPI003723FA80
MSTEDVQGTVRLAAKTLLHTLDPSSYPHGVDRRDELIIPVNKLIDFAPAKLGARIIEFDDVVCSITGLPQSQIPARLEGAVAGIGGDNTSSRALRLSLLILRDYINSGYYPLVQDRKLLLAPLLEAQNLDDIRRRQALRMLYRQARLNAVREASQRKALEKFITSLTIADYQPGKVVSALEEAPPDLSIQIAQSGSARLLWRGVRTTWSMTPDASAPGREVSIVLADRRWPSTPIAVAQFRNVVPGVRQRDTWLGMTARNATGGAGGYVDRLAKQPDERTAVEATAAVLRNLLGSVNLEGLPSISMKGGVDQADELARLASASRDRYNSLRREGRPAEARKHLAVTKRAETAANLSLGLAGLSECQSDPCPSRLLRADSELRRRVDAGLRKLWHYHMGFVALEMSICGAAPPFGALRVGKLAAALAGSEVVLNAWGRDRPLGEIAATVYEPHVREKVPNPGPLVVFTSGLYPGHSSQYNRASSGARKWRRIGETMGYGSFHVAADTVDAVNAFNEAVDGYSHITRTFGEGASARFRAIGKALSGLGLPDLRRHDTRRPLYALSLVEDPGGVLLGWCPAPVPSRLGISAHEIAHQWWQRWVRGQVPQLAREARVAPDLLDELHGLLRQVNELEPSTPQPQYAARQLSLLDQMGQRPVGLDEVG